MKSMKYAVWVVMMVCMSFGLVYAVDAENELSNAVPGPSSGTIMITGGTLAGQTLLPGQLIKVKKGTAITGTVNVDTNNLHGAGAVAPFGYTWSWGNRTVNMVEIDNWIPTGVTSWVVPINITAPNVTGTQYIHFAFGGEMNLSQVMARDNWAAGGAIRWNDGNDVVDVEGPKHFQFMKKNGYLYNWFGRNDSTGTPYSSLQAAQQAIQVQVIP